jgi:hypothetical protein
MPCIASNASIPAGARGALTARDSGAEAASGSVKLEEPLRRVLLAGALGVVPFRPLMRMVDPGSRENVRPLDIRSLARIDKPRDDPLMQTSPFMVNGG